MGVKKTSLILKSKIEQWKKIRFWVSCLKRVSVIKRLAKVSFELSVEAKSKHLSFGL